MSQNKSPDGSYPDFPFIMPIDGEFVTEDGLCVSATTGLGWIGKLVDAVGYLKARSPQVFNIITDGVGGVSFNRRTPLEDGATQMFSAIALSTTACTLTFTTAFASDRDYAAIAHNQGTVSSPFNRTPMVTSTSTVNMVVKVVDFTSVGAGTALDLESFACEFVLVVYPNLAGMT
jgi:hypothetical protein